MQEKLIQEIISKSDKDTFELGQSFGKALKGGEVILMFGEAGAGKTVFTKGVATSLGISERVTSPTFAIRNDYIGKHNLHHLDMYRIDDESELTETGALENLNDNSDIAIIEWAENVLEFFNFPHYNIYIKYKGAKTREISIYYFS